jgi:hypothetical protein
MLRLVLTRVRWRQHCATDTFKLQSYYTSMARSCPLVTRSHSTARCISRWTGGCRTVATKHRRRCECARRRPQDSTPLCSGEWTPGTCSNLTGPRCRCQCCSRYGQRYSIARSIFRWTRRHRAAIDPEWGGCPRTGSKPVDALASRVVQGEC